MANEDWKESVHFAVQYLASPELQQQQHHHHQQQQQRQPASTSVEDDGGGLRFVFECCIQVSEPLLAWGGLFCRSIHGPVDRQTGLFACGGWVGGQVSRQESTKTHQMT